MPARDPTVADWIAEGEATIEIHCSPAGGPSCGHHAVFRLETLDLRMTRSRLCRQAVCAGCGKRGGQVMRGMAAHYARLQVGGWSGGPFPTSAPKRENGAPAETGAPRAVAKGDG